MMIGDWAPMPMNVRGPAMRQPVTVPGHTTIVGRHYDWIIMDDVEDPLKVKCGGVARTATEASAILQEFEKRQRWT